MAKKQEEAMLRPSPRQCDAKDGHEHAWKPEEDRRQWQLPDGTVPTNYKIATRFKTQITPNFF